MRYREKKQFGFLQVKRAHMPKKQMTHCCFVLLCGNECSVTLLLENRLVEDFLNEENREHAVFLKERNLMSNEAKLF